MYWDIIALKVGRYFIIHTYALLFLVWRCTNSTPFPYSVTLPAKALYFSRIWR